MWLVKNANPAPLGDSGLFKNKSKEVKIIPIEHLLNKAKYVKASTKPWT
jgi:hypothetical protein